jgi:hypothetical protein
MLAKLLALWITLLAASPFTQPFSTVRLEWLCGSSHSMLPPGQARSAAAVRDGERAATPTNPPVEVRQDSSHSHRDSSLAASSPPGADTVVSTGTPDWDPVKDDFEHDQTAGSLFPVLRL